MSRPSVVRSSVSGTAVTENVPFETVVAVRQAPLIDTESPTPRSAAVSGASISRRTPSPSCSIEATRPRSRTIPVNIAGRLVQTPSASASSVSRAIISSSPRWPGAAVCRCSASSSTASSWPGARSALSVSARPRASSALPVCLASQREMSRISRSSARCSGLMDIGGQEDILADGRRAQVRERGSRGQSRACARDRRRHEEQHLVDEVFLEERGREGRAAFEQERLHVLLGEPPELFVEGAREELELRAVGKGPLPERKPSGLTHDLDVASVEPRVVRSDGSHPDGDGVRGRAQLVHEPPALIARDPALSRHAHPHVQRHCGLVRHERPPEPGPGEPGLVLHARLPEVDELDADTRLAQAGDPVACRILCSDDDLRDSCGDDRFDAGWRRPVMVAGLERDVERRLPGGADGWLERDDLRVRPALPLVPAFADDGSAADDDRSDDRVRMRRPAPALGELDGALEHQSAERARYAAARSCWPKTLVPATRRLAPASRRSRTLSGPTPPSTWMYTSSGRSSRRRRTRGSDSGMNGCPE